jgi:hypothetical protein
VRGNRSAIARIPLAVLVASIAWSAAAHADDPLERAAHFDIAPAPLATALIEFSTQSGMQVAVADSDVSHRNSDGVTGTLPIRTAISRLLQGTGLEFARIGTDTVAIRAASVGPAIGTLPGTTEPAAMATAAASDTKVPATTPRAVPDAAVAIPRPPTPPELAGDSVYQFVVHHATVHYVNTGARGNLGRWRGGRLESICPMTVGLVPDYNAFVTARLRALAETVGAPVNSEPLCKDNARIIFTNDPQKVMAKVVNLASTYFRGRLPSVSRLIAFAPDHAIQGWYITAGGGARALNSDPSLVGSLHFLPVWPTITPKTLKDAGDTSGIAIVIMVVDTTKLASYSIGTIADYVAMLTLSVVQSPDHCDPLPSILDVMAPSCDAREKPMAITAGDLAFLTALYGGKSGLGPSLSRDEIADKMMRQFNGR